MMSKFVYLFQELDFVARSFHQVDRYPYITNINGVFHDGALEATGPSGRGSDKYSAEDEENFPGKAETINLR